MVKSLCETPAGLVAVVIAARHSGDEILEADCKAALRERFGIRLTFGSECVKGSKSRLSKARSVNNGGRDNA